MKYTQSIRKGVCLLAALFGALLVGCQVNTLQYVVPEEKAELTYDIGAWKLMAPQVVAYRDVKDVSTMPHPDLFYLSMLAKCDKNTYRTSDLLIDSARIEFAVADPSETSNVSVWRHPTRVQPYNQDGWHHIYGKIFDFFGDQGIPIPMKADSIKLSFVAVVVDSSDGSRHSQPMSFVLSRDERSTTVPFSPR